MRHPPPTKNPDLDRPHDMVPNASHESVNTSKPEQAESSPETSGSEALKRSVLGMDVASHLHGGDPHFVTSTKPHPKRKVKEDDPAWKKMQLKTRLDPTKEIGGPSYIGDLEKAQTVLGGIDRCLAVFKSLNEGILLIRNELGRILSKDDMWSEYVPPDRVNDLPDGDERHDYSKRRRIRPSATHMSNTHLGQAQGGNHTSSPKFYKR
jgi:hypothetical protein